MGMAETHGNETAPKEEKSKPTSQVLRERIGGVPKEVLERNKSRQEPGRKIVKALREGPMTVPEIAKATGVPAYLVLWHIMSMKKYGKVLEGEEQDSYLQYALKEKNT
jgi:predicted Rossmann fold nucleotide-binding protein DprA/Smf involved in DNA uptake